MTTENKEEVKVSNVTKKNRRGVASARGVSRLKFSHEMAKPNGLFIAHLDSVEVNTIAIGEDTTGMPSFNGKEIPRIVFTFASNEEEAVKRHYQSISFNAVESNVLTIPGGKEEWKVNSVFDWIKHILNVYVFKGRDLTDEEIDALSLSYEDFNDNGEYEPVDVDVVLNGWKTLFENVENILNRGRDGQPYYKNKDGKNIPVWIKLIRYTKQFDRKTKTSTWSPVNNGDLSFPKFVGEGCIELYSASSTPSIKVDVVREAIIPMKVENVAKKPNVGAAPAGAPMGGIPVGDPMMSNNMGGVDSIAISAADDMPF